MILENLKMNPYCTTLMGVVKGTVDYYNIQMSEAMVFGGSGHAFLINIHNELCPSGPYCWDMTVFLKLLKNLGIEMVDLGFYSDTKSTDISSIEQTLKSYLDNQQVCSLLNLENQLIYGYQDNHFLTAQPWPGNNFPPATLTFGDWHELGESFHTSFFVLKKVKEQDNSKIVRDSLEYAISLFADNSNDTGAYGLGYKAYGSWISAVNKGYGSSHGNWWNGMVWSECRSMASLYFDEIAGMNLGLDSSLLSELSRNYKEISQSLQTISNKDLESNEKIEKLESTLEKEMACVDIIKKIYNQL